MIWALWTPRGVRQSQREEPLVLNMTGEAARVIPREIPAPSLVFWVLTQEPVSLAGSPENRINSIKPIH